MEQQHIEYIGLALFIASEIIGMSNLRSNSILQLTLSMLVKAFPYEPKRRGPFGLMDRKDRR